jgi:hypothetical protein
MSAYGEAEEDEFAVCSEDPGLLAKGGMWNAGAVEAEVRKAGRTCRVEGDLDLLVAHDPAGGGSGVEAVDEVGAEVEEDPVQP